MPTTTEIIREAKKHLKNNYQEHIIVVLLDGKFNILKSDMIFLGAVNRSLIHPREVLCFAIENRATELIIVHNHPTGDCSPSGDDNDVTKRFQAVCDLVGIPLFDHIIISNNYFFSYAKEGKIIKTKTRLNKRDLVYFR